VILIWQIITAFEIVDRFLLPPPIAVIRAFARDFPLLMHHAAHTLTQALAGLAIAIAMGYLAAIGMDRFAYIRGALYPLLVLSQTVPYVAIAPLLVLWLGYGMAPKIVLVSLACFFPIAVGVYDGIRGIPREYLDELSVLGGSYLEGLCFVKLPMSLPGFFSSAKIAVTYCFVGAVVAEWMGGTRGLGVYMTRVRRSFEFDKMFAVIFLIVIISLCLMWIVKLLERRAIKNVKI